MTTLREAATRALEALESDPVPLNAINNSCAVLRAALAEHYCDTHCTWADHAPGCVRAEPLEPVAWGVFGANLHDMFFTEEEAHEMAMLKGDGSTVAPLYASPPQRPAEPVNPTAWLNTEDGFCTLDSPVEGIDIMSQWVPLYASPPQRKPLTDDQLDDIAVAASTGNLYDLRIAIEAAHGIGSKT